MDQNPYESPREADYRRGKPLTRTDVILIALASLEVLAYVLSVVSRSLREISG